MTAEFLKRREMEHVLALLTPSNELVMRIALHTGLRVGDVLSLRPPVSRQFWITEQKTRKRRRVNLTQALVDSVNQQSGRYWCFPGRSDPEKHRTRQAVWRDVSRAAVALRLPVHVSPHSARKVYAVAALHDAGGNLDTVRRKLNHDDIMTTTIYALAETLYQSRYIEKDGRVVCKSAKSKKSKGGTKGGSGH